MVKKFGGEGSVFAIVMDSYDYDNALTKVLPAVAAAHKKKGGTMVLRPDSGDPVECILSALKAGEANFNTRKNMKGFKVRRHKEQDNLHDSMTAFPARMYSAFLRSVLIFCSHALFDDF
jgi:nicotinic acid phosphoribosyltransferase